MTPRQTAQRTFAFARRPQYLRCLSHRRSESALEPDMELEKDPPGSTNKTQSQSFGVVARCFAGNA